MIRFQCPECSAGLRVAEDEGGKLTLCPSCGRKVRAPAQVEIVEELPIVEDEPEEELEQVRPSEEGRPHKRRKSQPPPEEEEDEDDERRREVVTWNRIMGVVGVIFGLGFTGGAVGAWLAGVADFLNPLTTPYNAGGFFCLLLGLLLLGVGAFYAIRG